MTSLIIQKNYFKTTTGYHILKTSGGGLENILDLFKFRGANNSDGGGIGGLVKTPIISMMIDHFISKLVGKYSMSASVANNLSNTIIPNSINSLIELTRNPKDKNLNLDGFINSIIGGGDSDTQPAQTNDGGVPLQNLIPDREVYRWRRR